MQRLLTAMGRGNAKPAAGGVSVSAMLEGSVPLKSSAPEDRLSESIELMNKAKAAFSRAMTPEEKEMQEELAGMSRGGATVTPGEPSFAFVHKMSDAERAKLTSDALAEAKASAQRLATAAGGKLGPIRQLSENAASADGSDDYASYYVAQVMRGQGAAGTAAGEATSTAPGPIEYRSMVTVGYGLEF